MSKNVSLSNGRITIIRAGLCYPIHSSAAEVMLKADLEDGFISEQEYSQAFKLIKGDIYAIK